MREHPTAAGRSSYDVIDTELFWKVLSVEPGMTVLDLACGAGRYTLPLAERVGPSGRVIAVDLWAEGIDRLKTEAGAAGVDNIEAHVVDAALELPIPPRGVDLCLLATTLHDFAADGTDRAVLTQIARVLHPQGILSVVEFIKKEGPPGPPKTVRLSLEQVTMRLLPFGLIRFGAVVELGPHAYFCQFRRLRKSNSA